jgi:hypothetical protein
MTIVIHVAAIVACLAAAYLAARPRRAPRPRQAADASPDRPA